MRTITVYRVFTCPLGSYAEFLDLAVATAFAADKTDFGQIETIEREVEE